jgi:hypothetical protein
MVDVASASPMNLGNVVDMIQKIVTSAGVIIGAIWTYFLFVRGRTLKPRIVPRISGSLHPAARGQYLLATVSVANRGGIVLRVAHEDTGVAVFARTHKRGADQWVDINAFDVLAEEDLVEPGVVTEDHYVMHLPRAPQVPLRLEFFLQGKGRFGRAPQWITSCVVLPLVPGVPPVAPVAGAPGKEPDGV